MLKTVMTGLMILILAVFGFVAFNSYSMRQHATSDEVFSAGTPLVQAATMPDATDKPVATKQAPAADTGKGGELTAGANGLTAAGGMTPPTQDSIPANPPDGEKFGANGSHYQLYRQGDITWRLNTDTGETCVIFATDVEWKKARVYRAGCRGHN